MEFLIEKINTFKIILASKSPRRQQLLNDLGINFNTLSREVDESYPTHLQREQVALYLALKKAQAFEDILINANTLVITADTIVCVNDTIINKPVDFNDAIRILKKLSGNKHEVFTGVCISSIERKELFFVKTEVYFKPLSDAEIKYYIEKFKPYDKAGAYGIQDWIGLIGIESINGSYPNVMGLPIKELYEHLLLFISN